MGGLIPLATLGVVLLIAIFVVTLGILTALKDGFNQVIKGLESIDGRMTPSPAARSHTGEKASRGAPAGPAVPKSKQPGKGEGTMGTK